MFSIERAINKIVAGNHIPGRGYLRLLKEGNGIARVLVTMDIRTRSLDNPEIKQADAELDLPIPDERGVFDVLGQKLCLVRRAEKETDGPLTSVSQLRVSEPEDIYAEIVGKALKGACMPVRHGNGEFEPDLFYSRLASELSASEYSRSLPAGFNGAEVLAWSRTIVLDRVELDPKRPIPEDWRRKIDPTTTPQSEKVATVYRLAKGATIERGRIVEGDCILDELMYNGSFAPACAPTQIYKINSTLMRYLDLESPQEPLVRHMGADPKLFHGRNLLTGIVHDRYNQMDQLTMSYSAAQSMVGYVYSSELIEVTSGGNDLLVREGETIKPGEIIAVTRSKEGTKEVRATKIIRPSVVDSIESSERIVNGYKGKQHRVVLKTLAEMSSGDKLMPRSGCKGCVHILPDEEMPQVKLNGQWRTLDLTVNPYPVAKRKNLSMLLEMALAETGVKEVPYDINGAALKTLFDKGYGHKKLAMRGGKELDFTIAAGMVFWMRSDSLHAWRSYGILTSKENFMGVSPDQGRKSGISYSPTFRNILALAKSCPALDKALMEMNFDKGVTPLVANLVGMLTSHDIKAIPTEREAGSTM